MTHANGCHISVSPDIYFFPPNATSWSFLQCWWMHTRGTKAFRVKMLDWNAVFSPLVSSPCRPFSQLINEKLLSSGALTAQASVLCWFHLCHYVALKATWWVTGELCGCIAFFSVPHNSRYLTRPWLFTLMLPSKSKGSAPIQCCLEELRRELEVGVRPCLTSPIHPRPPAVPPGKRQVVGLWEGWL